MTHEPNLAEGRIWLAIPAFNEVKTIRRLVEQALLMHPNVIVVDDCSTDATRQQLESLPIVLLNHSVNKGKAACIQTAFAYASQNADLACVITMDGDGQHDPADAMKLLAAWKAWPNTLIIGARLHDRSQFPKARYYANQFACFWISWAAGHSIADTQSGFRVYPRHAVEMVMSGRVRSDRFTFESEVLIEAARVGIRTMAVAIPGHYSGNARPSHFRPIVDTTKIVWMVAGKLLCKGMAPIGLARSLKAAPVMDVINGQLTLVRPQDEQK